MLMNNDFCNEISIFFIDMVVHEDLSNYFDIYMTDNISKDYSLFDTSLVLDDSLDAAGVTILPSESSSKITILISNTVTEPATILHELTHMHDMVLFSNELCNCDLSQVKKHMYYQTFINWSEFHVKQIDIPYMHLILDIIDGKTDNFLETFKSQIKTFYFPGYTQKFISKKDNLNMRDVMWYLGELTVCNLYDKENNYKIPDEVKLILPNDFQPLYDELQQCQDFSSFLSHIETIHSCYHQFRHIHI